jgi:hypothetical protein
VPVATRGPAACLHPRVADRATAPNLPTAHRDGPPSWDALSAARCVNTVLAIG